MSKQDPSEQVRFLVSCIGHTANGRPDFAAVAEELKIVSKAAAQKRYERMLKANGVSSSRPAVKASVEDEESPKTPALTPKRRKAAGAKNGSAKKKAKTAKSEDSDDDDAVKDAKPVVKATAKKPKKEEEEEEEDSVLSDPPESDGSDETRGS